MIELRVLGDPHVIQDGRAVELQRKPLAVLAYLALAEPGRYVSRDTLLATFWPHLTQSHGRQALRQALFCLRRALGDDIIQTHGDDRVALADVLSCDVAAFELAVHEGRLVDAARLYNGPVLGALHLRGCPEFEHWVDGERGPRERSYERVVEQLAGLAAEAGDHARAAEWLRRLVQLDPLRGRFVALLMDALRDAGDRDAAMREGERYARAVRREWNAPPDPAVRELLDELRTAPSSARAPVVVPTGPVACDLASVREVFAGRYDVRAELGGGKLTRVFVAHDPRLDRDVVLKVLKPEMRDVVEAGRFHREVSLVAEFNHPNIVPLFEASAVGPFQYYAMRHIPGDSLRARLRREGRLPIEHAVRIAQQVARGLQYAHDRQVAHRDLKPENLLLHEGTALISDFGTAIAWRAGGERLTAKGITVGTPEYMSPEQCLPGGTIDGRTDVYGLGCVLYEMLTGEPVFSGVSRLAILNKQQKERVTRPRILREAVGSALQDVVLTALAKDPADRFQTVLEFGAAVSDG